MIDAARRLPAARLRPDAHPSLPDALPRLRRRHAAARVAAAARLADGSRAYAGDAARVGAPRRRRAAALRHDDGPDDGDRARHRRRLRDARRDRAARRGRQVHDGLRPARSPPRLREQTRASIDESVALAASAGTARRTDGCARRSRRASRSRARASCSKRSPRSPPRTASLVHTHASEIARRSRGRSAAVGRPLESRVSGRIPASRRHACAPRIASG